MRICTLTFHRADNYGAMLQTYALQKKLSIMGFETEILDYRCKGIERQYRDKKITEYSSVKGFLSDSYKRLLRRRQSIKFAEFRNSLKLGAFCDEFSFAQVIKKYDVCIVGSDQVWNLHSSIDDLNFFLPVDTSGKLRKASYAASLGSGQFDDNFENKAKRLLDDFYNISLREVTASEYLNKKLNLKCQSNIDPVFLLKENEWRELINDMQSLHKRKYIFVYQLLKSERMVQYAKEMGKRKQLDVVIISRSLYKDSSFFDASNTSGPKEFLWYIANAEYVVTNSFHGMALSLLFNKEIFLDFSEIVNTKTRLECLGDLLGVKDRWISGQYIEDIDYSIVNKRIQTERMISEKLLADICGE